MLNISNAKECSLVLVEIQHGGCILRIYKMSLVKLKIIEIEIIREIEIIC